jgi:uncharacterized protein HemX
MTTSARPVVAALAAVVAVALFNGEAWAKGPSRSSSSSKPTSAKPVDKDKETRKTEINVDFSSRGGSSSVPGSARSLSGPAAVGGAAGAGAAAAAIAPGGPKDTPEEARKRLDAREAQLKAEQEEKARRRAEDERLAAQAVRDREARAAEAEKARLLKQQRSQQALGGTGGGCVYKPVMTDAEIAACKR